MKMRLLVLLLGAACGTSYYSIPDVTVQVVPKGALTLPLPTSILTTRPVVLGPAKSAKMQRRADGVLQLMVQAEEIHLEANDFGGQDQVHDTIAVCYDVDQKAKTGTVTGYALTGASATKYPAGHGSLAGCAPFDDTPDAGLPEALAAMALIGDTSGSEHFNFGTVAITGSVPAPAINSKPALFASFDATQGLFSPYPDVTEPMETVTRSLVVRGTLINGVPDALTVGLSPDALPFMKSVSVSGSDAFWHSRDERIYRISNDSLVLSMQYLGVGAANLDRDQTTRTALGQTLADLLEGDQWTGFFTTTDGSDVRFSVRTQTAATSDFKPVQAFEPLMALTPNARALRVCFSEQLDPASVTANSFTFDPPVAVTDVALSSSKLCASVATAARDTRPYRVSVSGVKSVLGNSLPSSVAFSINRTPNGVIDFVFELFAGFSPDALLEITPTTSGGAIGLITSLGRQAVWRATNGFAFAQPLAMQATTGVRNVEDALGHGLWVVTGLNDAGVSQVAHYDDAMTEVTQVPGDAYDLVSLGDGSAVVLAAGHDDQRIVSGVATPLPAAFHLMHATGFVRGSSDVLVSTATTTERRQVTDGALVTTYPVSGVKIVLDDYLCAFSLHHLTNDGGVTLVSNAPCLDVVKTPSGQVVMSGGEGRPVQMFTVTDNTAQRVSYQVMSQPDHPYVSRPRFTSTGVFFNAESEPGFVPSRANLERATTAQWQSLTDGGLQ